MDHCGTAPVGKVPEYSARVELPCWPPDGPPPMTLLFHGATAHHGGLLKLRQCRALFRR